MRCRSCKRKNILPIGPSSGELLEGVTHWKLFCFNPVEGKHTLERTSKPRRTVLALAAPFFGHHLQKFTRRRYLSPWSVLFQPRGLSPATWDWTFPWVWGYPHSHCFAESGLLVVCVPWLGALTPATSLNGLDWCVSAFRLVWDLLPTHRILPGLLITVHNLACAPWKLEPSRYMLLSSAVSLCFSPGVHHELWLLNHS